MPSCEKQCRHEHTQNYRILPLPHHVPKIYCTLKKVMRGERGEYIKLTQCLKISIPYLITVLRVKMVQEHVFHRFLAIFFSKQENQTI